MLAVVKTPRTNFEVKGDIPKKLIDFLKSNYKTLKIIEDDEESIPLEESEWFQEISKKIHPGDTVKVYRENYGWTQNQLGEKLGVHKQVISEIERGKRAISKKMAIELSKLFNRRLERFLKL